MSARQIIWPRKFNCPEGSTTRPVAGAEKVGQLYINKRIDIGNVYEASPHHINMFIKGVRENLTDGQTGGLARYSTIKWWR